MGNSQDGPNFEKKWLEPIVKHAGFASADFLPSRSEKSVLRMYVQDNSYLIYTRFAHHLALRVVSAPTPRCHVFPIPSPTMPCASAPSRPGNDFCRAIIATYSWPESDWTKRRSSTTLVNDKTPRLCVWVPFAPWALAGVCWRWLGRTQRRRHVLIGEWSDG
jgi:hypothetical protein